MTKARARPAILNRQRSYADAYRAGLIGPHPHFVRASGRVMGHVMYLGREGRFQVDLVDSETREKRTVYVPAVLNGPTSLDRTVAFRAAIRDARWATRAKRHGKRIIVRKAGERSAQRAA